MKRQEASSKKLEVSSQKIKESGMDFACWLIFDVIHWLKGLTGEFSSEEIESKNWRWKLFLFFDWLEFIPQKMFTFFYHNSDQELFDALNLEFGEKLDRYNSFQQNIIILNRENYLL